MGHAELVLYLLSKGANPTLGSPNGDTPLHWLWVFPDPDIAPVGSALIAAGADVNALAEAIPAIYKITGNCKSMLEAGTPLHRAVLRSRVATALLVEHGADPLLQAKSTPFHSSLTLACSSLQHNAGSLQTDQVGTLGLLLQRCSVANKCHGGEFCRRLPALVLGNTLLERLILTKDLKDQSQIEVLKVLSKYGESFLDINQGFSLLHLAVKDGALSVVKYLLEIGTREDVNLTFRYKDCYWHPPLFYAIENGDSEMYKILIVNGADVLQRFQTDFVLGGIGAPLEGFFFPGDPVGIENLDRMKLRGPRSIYLHTAITSGSAWLFLNDLMKGKKLEPSSYDSNWESPLFLAIIGCDFESADKLIEAGGEINILRDDRTMLGHMVEDGFMAPYAAFEYLLKAQLRHGPKGCAGFVGIWKENRTIFHILLQWWDGYRNIPWSEALLDLFMGKLPDRRMIDVQTDMTADTALTLAVDSMNITAVRRLLEWGADPNIPDFETGTPIDHVLHSAYKIMQEHKIDFKMMREPDVDMADHGRERGDTIHKLQRLEIIHRLLIEYGGRQQNMTPPYTSRFSMTNRQSDEFYERHRVLGMDSKSITKSLNTDDGPMIEILKEIQTAIG